MSAAGVVVYGATGYTGRLVTAALVEAGQQPVLAGRNRSALEALAAPRGLEVRVGGLHDVDLAGTVVLINCAGPFSLTQAPLVEACLRRGVHYLDLAGEVQEHTAIARRDSEGRHAGVLLLPGAGFGIVPSETLLAHVAARLPGAERAELALRTVGTPSRGTAEVVLGQLRTPGVQRRQGRLVEAPAGREKRRVDFGDGDGPRVVVTNPWRADVLAAVPTVPALTTLMAFPRPVRALMRVPHGALGRRVAHTLPEGPTPTQLEEGRAAVWARAHRGRERVTSVVTGPDPYLWTAAVATLCLSRVLLGEHLSGYRRPSELWGPDMGLDLPGVDRRDLD